MKIEKIHEGKKVHYGPSENNVTVLFVHENSFFGQYENDGHGSFTCDGPWELVEDKKLLAPALCKSCGDLPFYLSNEIFSNENEAREFYGGEFIKWPCPPPNEKGFYEV